ncbi:MAG: RagB/SusD family nutrient uptake outer membrane protein [Bacteroidales bacterium]|nr:RagB/SusD family nutrient uptake outer membrane protein [Bacteroidales bacterium]
MKKIYMLIVAIIMFATSCSEEFLEQKPSNSISEEVVLSSLDAIEIAINGTYKYLSSYYFDALFYQAFADLRSGEAILASANNYGWFVDAYKNNITVSSLYPEIFWIRGYQVIVNANKIMDNLNDISGDVTKIKQYYAETLALRAYSHLLLANVFADKPYSVNPDAKCIPIKLSSNLSDSNIPRAKVRDVYKQIIKDLLEAEPLIGNIRTGRFSRRAVQGVLARAYLDMENWEKAAHWASICHANQDLDTAAITDGFYDYNSETILGYDFTDTDHAVYRSHPSFWYIDGPNSNYLYGYSTIMYAPSFVNIFADNDKRKMFIPGPRAGFFGVPGTFVTYKFRHRNDNLSYANLIRMRVAEMYLIEAEALAKLATPDYDRAQKALLKVQARSIPGATESTNEGQTLLNEIYLERRKELYGEGFGVFDLMRLQLPVDRSDNLHWGYSQTTIPANADILSFPIPQVEIDANDAISENDQNPFYK